MAPSYANLFLAKFEIDALSRARYQIQTWWRYIEDIFMIWTHSVDALNALPPTTIPCTYLSQSFLLQFNLGLFLRHQPTSNLPTTEKSSPGDL